jgi:hypothetical protein
MFDFCSLRSWLFANVSPNCQLHIYMCSLHGAERGETTAMLLSPSSRSSAVVFSGDSTHQSGSQFTMFLTAPLQAFCFLIGNNGMDIDRVHIFKCLSNNFSDRK